MCISDKPRELHVAGCTRLHNESLPILCLIGYQLEEALGHLSHTERRIFKKICECVLKNNG